MGTRLLPIALDLLAPTLVAGSSHPASLLHLLGIGDRGFVRGIIMLMVEMRIIVFRGKTSKILAVKRTGGSSHGAQRTGQKEEEDSFNSYACVCVSVQREWL